MSHSPSTADQLTTLLRSIRKVVLEAPPGFWDGDAVKAAHRLDKALSCRLREFNTDEP